MGHKFLFTFIAFRQELIKETPFLERQEEGRQTWQARDKCLVVHWQRDHGNPAEILDCGTSKLAMKVYTLESRIGSPLILTGAYKRLHHLRKAPHRLPPLSLKVSWQIANHPLHSWQKVALAKFSVLSKVTRLARTHIQTQRKRKEHLWFKKKKSLKDGGDEAERTWEKPNLIKSFHELLTSSAA